MQNVKKVSAPMVRILYLRNSKEAAMKTRDTVEASSGHTGQSFYGVVRVSDAFGGMWAVVAMPRERLNKMAETFWRGPLD